MLESKCGPGIKEQILQVIFYEVDTLKVNFYENDTIFCIN